MRRESLRPRHIAGALAFERVTFGYKPEEPPTLHDLSATIEAGEIVALVGPSGAGKTTIVNLVPRFYEPQSGRILLDGLDLARRRARGVAGRRSRSCRKSRCSSAARLRRTSPTESLDASRSRRLKRPRARRTPPNSSRTSRSAMKRPSGTAGLRLSGGQRQRISIARAVLARSAHPDLSTRRRARSTVTPNASSKPRSTGLLPGRTTLIIAHRLSTIRRANKILVHCRRSRGRGGYARRPAGARRRRTPNSTPRNSPKKRVRLCPTSV